jgi:hypothetical protein
LAEPNVTSTDTLTRANEARGRGSWEEARDLFQRSLAVEETPGGPRGSRRGGLVARRRRRGRRSATARLPSLSSARGPPGGRSDRRVAGHGPSGVPRRAGTSLRVAAPSPPGPGSSGSDTDQRMDRARRGIHRRRVREGRLRRPPPVRGGSGAGAFARRSASRDDGHRAGRTLHGPGRRREGGHASPG